jgi:hypothetical protein
MSPVAAIGLCLLAAFEITVSPDQPLPYSYTDDPLIIEFRSEEAVVVDIHVTATPDHEASPQIAEFSQVTLGPDINRWYALKEMPPLRGPWNLAISIVAGENEENLSADTYRIDRPRDAYGHKIHAYADDIDRNGLLALRSVGIETVRLPVTHPGLSELLETVRALEMKAIVSLSARPVHVALLRALEPSACDALYAWTLRASFDSRSFQESIQALRDLECPKPIYIVLPEGPVPESMVAQTAQGQRLLYEGDPKSLRALRETMAMLGLPATPVDGVVPSAKVGDLHGFLPHYVDCIAQGAEGVGIPVSSVYADGRLMPGLGQINGLMQAVPTGQSIGSILQAGGRPVQVFSVGERWTAAAWASDDTGTLLLPWSDSISASQVDSWGNSVDDDSDLDQGTYALDEGLIYVLGVGGPVLREALSNRAKAEALLALEDEELRPAWSGGTRGALSAVASDPAGVSSRVEFFTLLRAFPEIEERWHGGQLTRPVATTALARLATLARTLCGLEAALGSGFLEPLPDTLARCESFQSAYLTGATTSPQARKRGDWLVAEVRRLMDEAEDLAMAERPIEADAVAALAEWQARGLEFAAKASPLSDRQSLPEIKDLDVNTTKLKLDRRNKK